MELARHEPRMNFEFNEFDQAIRRKSRKDQSGSRQFIELPGHPCFVASQFHPEFTSTPRDGHPLFTGFVRAARVFRASLQPGRATA